MIDGQKTFITNSGTPITKCVTITARTGPNEISNIVVDSGTPGFDVAPPYRKMGWHASDTHELSFSDCRVPADHLLGERGRGFQTFLSILDGGRVAIAALAVGLAQACLDASLEYARARQAFGGPIGRFQAVAFKCADMARRGRERAQPHVQGRVAARSRQAAPPGRGDGEALRERGGGHRDA